MSKKNCPVFHVKYDNVTYTRMRLTYTQINTVLLE